MRLDGQITQNDSLPLSTYLISEGLGSLLVKPAQVQRICLRAFTQHTKIENEREISVVHNFAGDVEDLRDALLSMRSVRYHFEKERSALSSPRRIGLSGPSLQWCENVVGEIRKGDEYSSCRLFEERVNSPKKHFHLLRLRCGFKPLGSNCTFL
jgi:hypothetical protein